MNDQTKGYKNDAIRRDCFETLHALMFPHKIYSYDSLVNELFDTCRATVLFWCHMKFSLAKRGVCLGDALRLRRTFPCKKTI